MKKVILIFVVALAFASCGKKADPATTVDTTTVAVDTTAVDTTAVDTTAVDTTAAVK